LDKPKPIDFRIIAERRNFTPSDPRVKVAGAFNASAAKLEGRVAFLIRVAESPKIQRDGGYVYYPRAKISRDSGFNIEMVQVPEKEVLEESKRAFRFPFGIRLKHISHFKLGFLEKNGDIIWEQNPVLYSQEGHENLGLEDARITSMGEKEFLVSYVSLSEANDVTTSFARTRDFRTFDRFPISDNTPRFMIHGKDVVFFPERIPNPYLHDQFGRRRNSPAAFTRSIGMCSITPEPQTSLTYFSDDFTMCGLNHCILASEKGKVTGPGPAPIWVEYMEDGKKKEGWLFIFHDVEKTRRSNIYRTASGLLDGKKPWVLSYRREPFIEPNEHGLGKGYVNHVVYTIGEWVDDGILYLSSGENDFANSLRSYHLEDLVSYTVGRKVRLLN